MHFLLNGTYASAGFAVIGTMKPVALWAARENLRWTLTYRYKDGSNRCNCLLSLSRTVTDAEVTTWVQIDTKETVPIRAIQLFPASERMEPGRDQYYGWKVFPYGSHRSLK